MEDHEPMGDATMATYVSLIVYGLFFKKVIYQVCCVGEQRLVNQH